MAAHEGLAWDELISNLNHCFAQPVTITTKSIKLALKPCGKNRCHGEISHAPVDCRDVTDQVDDVAARGGLSQEVGAVDCCLPTCGDLRQLPGDVVYASMCPFRRSGTHITIVDVAYQYA